jgi:DNA sulfur modification protein DndD
MILHSLKLTNFRQFRGTHQLSFAASTGDGEPNVTVVFGENGRGKTGIFRALVFALYNERRLSQDGDVPAEELQLVNTAALDASGGKPVRTSVEVDFSHKGSRYLLRRALVGMRDGDRVLEELDEVYCQQRAPDGNATIIDPADTQRVVAAVLDPRVKEYFLFDGERIERLTRASLEQRQEVRRGIRDLLSVDALDTAIAAASKLARALDAEVASKASSELSRLFKRLGDNEDGQATARGEVEQLTDEIRRANAEKTKVDRELDAIKEIRHIIDQRKLKESELGTLQQQAANALASMRSCSARAGSLLVAPLVQRAFAHIDQQKQRGEIPSEIRRDLIERLLSEHRCICGRELRDGTGPHAAIREWQARTGEVSLQDAALNLWRYLSEVHQRLGDDAAQIENRLVEYGLLRNRVAILQGEVDDLSRQISGSERQDALHLEDHRTRIEGKLRELEARSLYVQQQLAELDSEHEQLQARLTEEKRKAGRTDELARRAFLVRETRDALQAVHKGFTQEVRVEVADLATSLLGRLLDAESRTNLRTVVVNDDYSLQVLDRWGQPFLANISAGQRQVLSIAFIAALARAAGRGGKLEMPLFMDTPFGRLSTEHRRNLIAAIPDLAAQWVLLATDTEFRRQEAQWLRAGGRWGRFYRLRAAKGGSTTVEELDVDSALALLRDGRDAE